MAIVEETKKYLPDMLADMVDLLLLTGMRPSELFPIDPGMIDRTGDVWTYQPPKHKNMHKQSAKARQRMVCFGERSQSILANYLLRDHETLCFVPSEIGGRWKLKSFDKDNFRKAIQRAALEAYPVPEGDDVTELQVSEHKATYAWFSVSIAPCSGHRR